VVVSTLDLSVYLVTEPAPDLEAVVGAAARSGIGVVQLRDKDATARERSEATRRLAAVLAPHGVPLVVDDDLDAARFADGVHVGPHDAHPTRARAALGADAVVGWSIDDLRQLDDEEAVLASTYLAVSPVWATPTKPDHARPWGLDGVRRVVDAVDGLRPVVAIGGITSGNAADVVAAGADGVAVVSAVTRAPDPAAATRALRRAVTEGRSEGRSRR